MKVATYEANVEKGQINLFESARLPEHARVYLVIPGIEESYRLHVWSPRLARPERAAEFTKEVVEERQVAGLRQSTRLDAQGW